MLVVAFGCVVGFGSAASAGGWAVTTLDEVPSPTPGRAISIGFAIRQHGVSPVDLDEGVAIEITAGDGSVQVFPAANDRLGHYVATVVFPSTGDYSWSVLQGWFGEQSLGTLSVESAAATEYRFPAAVRFGLPVLAAVFAGLAAADALVGMRRRRPVLA
jgi:hypothetical protein